jgi:RNA polymerase sigma-70 factor (ECF subfamily)
MDDEDFAGLLARVRSGDQEAASVLLHRFEHDVRMMVRVRLPRALRSQFDSMDFVQAVWQSVLTGPNQDLDRFANEKHFLGFLSGVARNKVLEEHRRRTQTRKYDVGREEPLFIRRGDREVLREVATPDPTPSQKVQEKDRFRQLVADRSPQEAEIIELRRRGMTFEEIAEQTGLNERSVRRVIEALRQRLETNQWR